VIKGQGACVKESPKAVQPTKKHVCHDSLPDLGAPMRDRGLKTLHSILNSEETLQSLKEICPDFVLQEDTISNLCIEIEEALYSHISKDYTKTIREKTLLLKSKGSADIRLGLITGELSPLDFVEKDSDDLHSENMKELLNQGKQWKMKA